MAAANGQSPSSARGYQRSKDMTVGHQLISEGRWMQPELDLLKANFC